MDNVGMVNLIRPSNPEAGPVDRPTVKLTIVLPALNEEGAIGSTIQRCLDAARGSSAKPTSPNWTSWSSATVPRTPRSRSPASTRMSG